MYNGGFIQLQKRFSQHFQVLTSYTFSKVIDTAPDATQWFPATAEMTRKSRRTRCCPTSTADSGNADVRHRFVFSARVGPQLRRRRFRTRSPSTLLTGWELSTIAQVQSGRPFTATVTGDPNNDGNNYQRPRSPGGPQHHHRPDASRRSTCASRATCRSSVSVCACG